MASKFFHLVKVSSFLIIFHFLSSRSLADVPLNTPLPPETICKSTPHPSYCTSVLPHNNESVYDFGRFSVQHALSESHKLLDLYEKYLQKGSSLTNPAIQALEDCKQLALLNIDFLSSSLETVNKVSDVLPILDADDVQTLLSAILTNHQTCSDGIASLPSSAGSVLGDLSVPLSNNTKLFSTSLALFTKGWVPKDKNGVPKQPKRQFKFGKGRLNLKMSSHARAIYDSAINHRGRRLLQVGDEEVLVKDIVVVSQDGSGNFTTINQAIAVAPNNSVASGGYFMIYITAGVYKEYVSIISQKKYLLFIGDGINQTIITGNNSVGDGSTTFNSATLAVVAQGFMAVNITVRNTAGPSKGQAVALRSGADFSVFYSCSFEGYQDTLYTHSLRQFYRECDIYGTVDFIFGNAAVVLQNCNIYPRQPNQGQANPITAQGRTDPNQNTGTSIHNCTIKPTPDLASSNYTVKTYLGRPWKEYSRTVYMQTFMGSLIDPAGWLAWSGDFALSTLYYAEYNNTGPGSRTTNRVTWPGYHVINATVAVVLQNCNIYPRQPNQGQSNPITAQGRTDPNQNTGTSIHNCTITPTPDLASSNYTVKTYLGRPWKEYSRTVYMQTFMGSLIDPAGWLAWSGDFALSTLYYAEYNNTGPGSRTTNRVTWPGYHVINATVAANFTVSNFLLGDNWLPDTGVPYTGGLV